MNDLSARDLRVVRLRFYDILKSFLDTEPDAEKLSRWRGVFSALRREQISPGLDRSAATIHALLAEQNLADIQEEYYELFVNPFSDDKVILNGSYYRDDRIGGPSLVEFRAFLKEAGLTFDRASMLEDDSLLVMLDFMATLIGAEKDAQDSDRLQGLQSRLLNEYLRPTAQNVGKRVGEVSSAAFYSACFTFMTDYLDIERALFDSGA
jgi:TorA maturation chaperone TorD